MIEHLKITISQLYGDSINIQTLRCRDQQAKAVHWTCNQKKWSEHNMVNILS